MAATNKTDHDLRIRLADVLPKNKNFNIHHLSTKPSKSDPLYSPPPSERPDRTFCEKHFLAVAIDQPSPNADNKQVFILGVEIFIFTTSHSTTIFVSKADSTGYLHLLGLPSGTPSPIRQVCATFISFLVDKRKRKDVQVVVSLFARAQSQYLFPGSVKNKGKHVLDDRGLVKWWCRVLDPLLEDKTNGYLVVPGLEAHETRAFVPRGSTRWTQGHPLQRISHYAKEFDWVPPRCLIPSFPDDPKSRFRDELDEEATKTGPFRTTGSWNSVKTLDMFWEMMAFRQECSSGRLTGFIWVVFNDVNQYSSAELPSTPKAQRTINITPSTTPRKLHLSKLEKAEDQKSKKPKKKSKLRGPVITRLPKIKKSNRNLNTAPAKSTVHYTWPLTGRGERVVDDKDYKRIVELLLHLDFATLDKAAGSTQRWVGEVGMGVSWGFIVTGTLEVVERKEEGDGVMVHNLNGLVKRKRTDSVAAEKEPVVTVLGSGLIRKKPKV